jgi:predicted permease
MSLSNRIANLFRRCSVDREIARELAAHIEMRIEDNLAAGMTPKEARRDALVRFGSRSAAKERTAEADAALFATGVWADLRYAIRQLWRAPGFACTAIVVLALGIAASVAIFAFVDAALIKPLPYRDPGRLVALFESNPLGPRFHLSYLDYLDWKRINSAFNSLDAYDGAEFVLDTASGTQRALGATVSDGFFRTLGVAPALGRDFHSGEDLPSAPRTVLLSYATWQTRYGARADVLGQAVTLNGLPNTIVGVLPQGFHFATVGNPEFWTTLHRSTSEDRGEHGLLAIARLKKGIDIKTASANLSSIAETLAKQYPDADAGRGATVVELPEMIVGRFRPVLLVLLSGAALLLLIAYVNVASLLLVRSENRRLEVALREALGATPRRLARQFVTEGMLLAAVGCGIGLTAASVAMKLLTKLISTEMMSSMPYLQGLSLNADVLLFSGFVAAGAALLFSVVPLVALAASSRLHRSGLSAGLSAGQRGFAGTLWRRIGSNLVVVELATAMVLLVCAGLLGKSFYRLLHTEIGMQPDHLATLRIDTPRTGYDKNEQLVNLGRTIISRVESLPGVQSVGLAQSLPVGGNGGSSTFKIVGRPPTPSPSEEMVRSVSPGYFSTLHSRLLHGRFFLPVDDASHPDVVIVNEAMAKRYFPGEDPLGKRLVYNDSSPQMEVVGVVEDVKEGELDHVTRPILYVPYAQNPDRAFYVIARTSQSEESLLPVIAAAIHEIDPGLMTYGAETMIDRINSSQAAYLHRSSAWLVGGFAALALVLAVVGLYGVISYSVSQRTREIGVRMALGAQQSSVYRMILSEAGWLSGIGIAAGLICSVAAAMLMRSLLFGTQAWDAATLCAVAALLAAAAMLASYIPAHRAASVNPVEALRAE